MRFEAGFIWSAKSKKINLLFYSDGFNLFLMF